jgi:uncharacterized NAD-dependent epimerase/dehydratase family protein
VGKKCQDLLGAGGDLPIRACVADFLEDDSRPDTLLVGITVSGGQLPPEMRRPIRDAIDAGLDVWNGLHEFLGEDEEFAAAAKASGSRLWDVRRPPRKLPVGTGACLNSKSAICLTVGTDCAVGKMTASLEVQRALMAAGTTAEFVATGQTGMMISGWGHPIDAIVGDFMAGAVEKDCLSVDGTCDVILVEGQGSLWHPGFSSVTLALIHGAMPRGMVLCHQAGRAAISKREHIPIPPLARVWEGYVRALEHFRVPELWGGCLNTWGLPEDEARRACEEARRELGVPVTDPVRFGCGAIADTIRAAVGR